MKILVTGSKGFVGKNLVETLKTIRDGKYKTNILPLNIEIYEYDKSKSLKDLYTYTKDCDFIVHLAGVNRTRDVSEYYEGNVVLIEKLCSYLKENKNQCPILVSSSMQVGRDNIYAKSKKAGENYLLQFHVNNGNPVYIYRFTNLFGKWCRPNYNSVVATWCYNIAHDLEIMINDENVELSLCYIDDVIEEILHCIAGYPTCNLEKQYYTVLPVYNVELGTIRDLLLSFKESRKNLTIPNQYDEFTKKLYATYLSYLPDEALSYSLKMNVDERGSFTEFIRTNEFGQVSINITKPGIIKGQHWHHTKNEKFLVVHGEGIIQLRKVGEKKVIEYKVSGEKLEVIDIPIGYTHNIINVGEVDLVTVMWVNEELNLNKTDTYFEKVEGDHIWKD